MDDLKRRMNEAAANAVKKIIQYQTSTNTPAMLMKANQRVQDLGGWGAAAKRVTSKPINEYFLPTSTPARQIAAPYIQNKIVEPAKQGVRELTARTSTPMQRGMGALKAVSGVLNATPAGVAANAFQGGLTAAAKARTGSDPRQAFGQSFTSFDSSFAKDGLNIQNPMLALGVDVITGDPKSLFRGFSKTITRSGDDIARVATKSGVRLAKDEIDDLVRAQDILVNPNRYFPKDAPNPVVAEQTFNKIQEEARKTINILAQRYAPDNVLAKAGDDMNKMATELYKLSQKGKLGVFDVPAYGFVQGKPTSSTPSTQTNLSKQLSQESMQSKGATSSLSQELPLENKKIQLEPQTQLSQDITQLGLKQGTSQASITPKGMKERKFSETIMSSDRTMPPTKADYTRQYYTPITNKDTLKQADQIISKNIDEAMNVALNGESTALNNAISMRLVEKLQKEGNISQAVDLLESLSKKPTSQGQAIQVLSYWSKLTPAGAIRKAQNLVSKANLERGGENLSLTPEKAKKISSLAESLQGMKEGREKMLATAKLLDEIESVVPPTLADKVSTLQTMAQLLNPKTAIRNTVGNLLFATSENAAGAVAAILDVPVSLVTGKRSKALPNVKVQVKGFKSGFKEGLEEALKGVNLDKTGGQVDLNGRQTFSGPFLGTLEKIMNVELRATDKAFYRAAFDDSLLSQMKLAKVEEPTPEMLRIAHFDGLYKTFQDDTLIARGFSTLKKALNLGKGFGLGDIILKYPKTPANIIQRGIDYSPLGLVNSLINIAKPFVNKTPFDQKAFVESLSRSLVGTTSLVSTGYALHKAGLITGKAEDDRDVSALQRQMGMGGYKLNVDGLVRFVTTGFNKEAAKPREGDRLITYDWAQPMAIGLSMGANISENNGRVTSEGQLSAIVSAIQGGVDTLQEQPLVTGLRQFMRTGDAAQAIADGVQSLPASFTPTLSNQVNQAFDNTARETYSPDYFQESLNQVKAKIPVLAQTLPARSTVLGGTAERYQDGSNNLFNVFFNPAFVSKIRSSAGADEVLRIFNDTGETSQAPRLVPRKVKINGVDRELTGSEVSQYQNYVGTRTNNMLNEVVQTDWFKSMDDERKVKFIQKQLTDINSAAKAELFGNNQQKLSSSAKGVVLGNYSSGYTPASASSSTVTSDQKLNKALSLPENNEIERRAKQREIFKTALAIEKGTGDYEYLSPEKKSELLKATGVSEFDVKYYKLAQAPSDDKVAFIKEYTQELDKRGFSEFLILGRKLVNGKRLVDDSVVSAFQKEGLITSQDAKFLKNTEVDDTNKIKVKFTGRGSSAKIKKISGIKVANPKRLRIKRSKALTDSQLGKLVLKAKPTKRAKIVAPRII